MIAIQPQLVVALLDELARQNDDPDLLIGQELFDTICRAATRVWEQVYAEQEPRP